MAKVVEAARAKRGVPSANAASKAVAMLKDVRARIKDDQPRFAEEIAQEMFDKQRADDATIAAAAEMADYYFKKVMAEPRDKWMNRMVEAYPQHPKTQATLLSQVAAEQGQRNYDRVAAVSDTGIRLFPGAAWKFFGARIEAFNAAQNQKGAAEFAGKYLGERISTEVEALSLLQRYQTAANLSDPKTKGDQWMEAARRLAGTRGEVYCVLRAYYEYTPGGSHKHPEQTKPLARALRMQQIDGEIRWSYEFVECTVLASQGQGVAAAKLAAETLGGQTNVRDLYARLSYSGLAGAMGKEKKPEEASNLAKKIKEACPSAEDQLAADWLEGGAYDSAEKDALAAKKYLEVLDKHPHPAMISPLVASVQKALGNTPEMHSVSQKLVKEFGGAQDVVPSILLTEGLSYLNQRQMAGVSKIRGMLSEKYAASMEREKLEDTVQNTLNPPPKKPPAEKKP